MLKFEYGRQWSSGRWRLTQPMDESQARLRFDGKVSAPHDWFSVAAWRDGVPTDGPVEFVLEVKPRADFVGVHFYDLDRRLEVVFGFRKHGESLFRESIVEYTYPSDGSYFLQGDASMVETSRYGVDGTLNYIVNDVSRPTIREEDYRNVDVSEHWEPIPEFGQWESLGRYKRS